MKRLILTLTFLVIVFLSFGQTEGEPPMVKVNGGSFYMGNDYSPALDEKPEHKVTLNTFYIGKYEVTFKEFDLFCRATGYPEPDDGGFGRDSLPVMNVSWEGAIMYCNWLSSRYRLNKVYKIVRDSNKIEVGEPDWTANGYRLPTEAEWEYVAKGGDKPQGFAYCGSNDPKEVAWYAENSGGRPHPVGKLKDNGIGVYDLLGNVAEWCWDWYDKDYYSKSPETNPRGPASGKTRVYRGGNFKTTIENLRVTKRFSLAPNVSAGNIGIRLARNAE